MSSKKPSPRAEAARAVAAAKIDGKALRAFFQQKAREATAAGVVLEVDDELLVERACAALDRIRSLERAITSHGEVVRTATGTLKANPAVGLVRQQDAVLAKLIALIGLRIELAAGQARPRGRQPGSTIVDAAANGVSPRAPRRGTPMRRRSS